MQAPQTSLLCKELKYLSSELPLLLSPLLSLQLLLQIESLFCTYLLLATGAISFHNEGIFSNFVHVCLYKFVPSRLPRPKGAPTFGVVQLQRVVDNWVISGVVIHTQSIRSRRSSSRVFFWTGF